MILRSVMKHVRDQNWFAVGLDFLIVVVGVFIGIQVSNWNEKRQMQAELDAALRNFAQEVSTTIGTRRAQIENESEVIEGLRLMSELLDGAELDDQETDKAYQSLLAGLPHPDIGRYETLYELQSSGRLKDIPSRDLRGALGLMLSRDRTYRAYREYWAERLTAPPFNSAVVALEIAPPESLTPQNATRVIGVEIDAAREMPEVRNRVAQLYDFWYIVIFDAEAALRIERIALELLQSEGFQPAQNWMMDNLGRIQPDPQLEQSRSESRDAPLSPDAEVVP